MKLICVFVFAYTKRWFSHDVAHINVEAGKMAAKVNKTDLTISIKKI